jgi:tRNA threonylcarbamoyladenosine modification (KEOPS) complex Cgi121 subunit
LILNLSEDGRSVLVSAFRIPMGMNPSLSLRELRTAIPGKDIQFFDGRHIAGKEHLELAAINASHAFKSGINISRTLAMETLLYASAQRQIDAAIAKIGVTAESEIVGFIAFSETEHDARVLEGRIAQAVRAELNEALLDEWSEKKALNMTTLYGISATELEAIKMPGQEVQSAIKKAVVERVALLSTRI